MSNDKTPQTPPGTSEESNAGTDELGKEDLENVSGGVVAGGCVKLPFPPIGPIKPLPDYPVCPIVPPISTI